MCLENNSSEIAMPRWLSEDDLAMIISFFKSKKTKKEVNNNVDFYLD